MKSMLILVTLFFSSFVSAQAPDTAELEVFKTCINELNAEITRGKKIMIKDFDLKVRQKDIFTYGPYNVSDQYFKVDYVIYAPAPSKVTVEFDLVADEEGCEKVMFNDYIY